MANNATPTFSDEGLLLNAEPFGFGPTAAIADFFPHLRTKFGRLGYIGTGHTLDLQLPLAYDSVWSLTDTTEARVMEALRDLRSQYRYFMTALDFGMAELAVRAGFDVIIYDPLVWFWREKLPPVVHQVQYIAQDFFGVTERLALEGVSNAKVVAPLVDAPAQQATSRERTHVLLNLGGLSNPSWSHEDTLAYARLIVSSFVETMLRRGETFAIATNAALAKEFAYVGARNYTREQMQEILRTARYAFMTPGLGNIYDAARFGTPTVWLPPANDSQAQQRDLLAAHQCVDAALDWSDLLPGTNIDYCAEQESVLALIAAAVTQASRNDDARARLTALMARLSDEVSSTSTGKCSALLQQFGSGGALQVADLVLRFAKERSNHAHVQPVSAC